MRNEVVRRLASALALAVLLTWASVARAQDVLEVAPKAYTKLLENNRIRVLEAHFGPGEKIPLHSMSEHLFYAVSGGTLVIKQQGKTPYEMTFEPGQVFLLPAQSRAFENNTRETVRTLIVEFKTAAPTASAKSSAKRRVRRGGRRRAAPAG